MPNLRDRSRFLLTIAAIAVSVLLFACGGDRKTAESADIPVRPRVSEAAVSVAAPTPPAAAPSVAVPQAAPEPPAPESEPAPQSAPEEEAPSRPVEAGGPRVFSNKDLRRYTKVKEEFGLDDDAVTVDLTPKAPESEARGVAVMTDAQRDEEMRETVKQINELNAEAAYLKSRIPALHNPFLARVKLSEADTTAEAGMDNAQRLARVNARLSQVDARRDRLQRRLTELSQSESAQVTP